MARPREYKTETFTSKTTEGMARRLEVLANSMQNEGWRLHSFQCPGLISGSCIVLFYREKVDANE